MTKTKRTAAEIRAYLAHNEDTDMPLHDYVAMLEEDVLRLLDAAVKLREARVHSLLMYWYSEQGLDYKEAMLRVQQDKLLTETAWLELSPEPALSPDGESEEGEA